jgi:hypothetical protein
LPVVLVILMGADAEQIQDSLAEVQAAQAITPFAPLFFSDSDRIDLFRLQGYLVEHCPRDETSASQVRARIRSIFQLYEPSRVVSDVRDPDLRALILQEVSQAELVPPGGRATSRPTDVSALQLTPEEIKYQFPPTFMGRVVGNVALIYLRFHQRGLVATIKRPLKKIKRRLTGRK